MQSLSQEETNKNRWLLDMLRNLMFLQQPETRDVRAGGFRHVKNTIETTPDPLPEDLYNIIACPVDKADLKYTKDKKGLQCTKCKYIYPIKEGIPILLPPELQ